MAWTTKTVNDVLVMTETGIVFPDSAGANVVGVGTTEINATANINNKKFVVYAEETDGSPTGDAEIECRLEGSTDGTTWATIDTTAAMDLDGSTDGNCAAEQLDASDFYLPYMRIYAFSSGSNDTGAAGELTVAIAFSPIV